MGIRSRIFFIVFVLLSISIAVTYEVAERDLNNTFKQETLNELEKKANLFVISVGSLNRFDDINAADLFANELGSASNSRVTFIKNDGQVIGDSELDSDEISIIDNHVNRSEVVDALKNGTGWSSRYSSTLNQDLLYFAIQDNEDANPNIIRISVPITYIDNITDTLGLSVLLLFIVVFIVSVIASGVSANYLYSNIQELANVASNISKGKTISDDIDALPTQRDDEFGTVARSISQLSEDLKNQIKIIAKQRDQFGLVLDDLGEGIIVTNKKGKVVFTNEQASVILNTENLFEMNIKEFDIPALNYLFKRVKNKKRADIEFEIEINRRTTKWVLGSMNQSKTTGQFILVLHDITQLRQLNSMRRDFISNLSHELRTPVSVIRANSETLLDGALEDKREAKIFSKAILHNAERLTSMVSDLIDLSRIDYGDLKLNIVEVNLDNFIKSFIDSMKSVIKKKDIYIEYQPRHKKNIMADVQALERVMNNLIDNAFKYSPKGSVIEISTITDNNHIKINVADEGTGISEIDQEYIFDRFYRTASARASENKGSGLGLAIVKNLINSLNGEVGVSNRPEGGSIFWFTLPIYKK
ncbi:MAG: PAS domain-containing sensor histidine kinase [Pelagibacteraceae bacterium]|nr:PAS domain-containing sensor histidine kinase [Pelagibacteraceae bacterium]|tara:strand:+ start:1737 stop:3500 length:1764 start_codon:yes stop_codon:yes gene_type:complete